MGVRWQSYILRDLATTLPPLALPSVAAATQDTLATIAFTGAGTPATGETIASYAWTLTKPTGSSAALSSGAAQSPTLVPDIAGTYVATLEVTQSDAQTSEPVSVSVEVGTPWLTFDPTLAAVVKYDPGTIENAAPVSAGSGTYTYSVAAAAARYNSTTGCTYWILLPEVTWADQFRVEIELDGLPPTVDNLVLNACIGDATSPPADGGQIGIKGIQSTGTLARGSGVGVANPSYVNIVAASLTLSGEFQIFPGDRCAFTYAAIAAGVYNTAISWQADTSVPAVGAAYLGVTMGATAAATGTMVGRLRYRVLPRS